MSGIFKQFVYRYAIIGINSFYSDPDVFTKITPGVKTWIRDVAPGAFLSDCSNN